MKMPAVRVSASSLMTLNGLSLCHTSGLPSNGCCYCVLTDGTCWMNRRYTCVEPVTMCLVCLTQAVCLPTAVVTPFLLMEHVEWIGARYTCYTVYEYNSGCWNHELTITNCYEGAIEHFFRRMRLNMEKENLLSQKSAIWRRLKRS